MLENQKRQMATNKRNNGPNSDGVGNKLKSKTCGKPHTTELCSNEVNAANDPYRSATTKQSTSKTTTQNQRHLSQLKNQKTSCAAPAFWGTIRREGIYHRGSADTHTQNSTTTCNGILTGDWQRRHKVAAIQEYNTKHELQ